MRPLLAFVFLLPLSAPADITATRESDDFTGTLSQIEGDVDPATLGSWQNHPSYPAPNLTLNGDGTITLVTPDDTYPNWNLVAGDYLDSATGWTWETRFRIDSANVANRGVWEIFLRDNDNGLAATRIHFLAGGLDRDNAGFGVDAEIAADLTDDFHVVRGAVEGGSNLTTVWLDGVKVIDALPSNTFDAAESGWVGRWGGQTRGGTTTIDYIRFDTTGAFAPVPSPRPLDLAIAVDSPLTQVTLSISSLPGDLFDIFRTEDLQAGFGGPLATDVPAAGGATVVTETIDDFSGGATLVDDQTDFDTALTGGTSYVFIPGDGTIAGMPSEVISWSGNSITIAADYGSEVSWTGPYTIETFADETTWVDVSPPPGGRAFYQVTRK